MTINDVQILLILAERARGAGLITFDEFPVVSSAVANAKAASENQAKTVPENTEETQAGESKQSSRKSQ